MKLPDVDRRSLLVGGGAIAGLTIGFLLWPRQDHGPGRPAKDERAFNAYLRIGTDNRVTLAVPQTETGQGIWTGLAQIAADELGAAWEQMAVEPAPMSRVYDNALSDALIGRAARLTAFGTSIRAFERPVREAAAIARALLCSAAAARWGVSAAECDSENGFVVHEDKRLGFGALADAASRLDAQTPVLRPARGGAMVGRDLPRLDLPPKTDGSWRFAGDVRLPGMRFASIRQAPPGGRILSVDRAAARRTDRSVRLVEQAEWIAAIADTSWLADRALKAGNVRFAGPVASAALIEQQTAAALDTASFSTLFERGGYADATDGSRPLAATYSIAPTPHRSLEPPAVVARVSGQRVEVWAATQAPDLARNAAAAALSLLPEKVTLYPMPAGDGGGRAIVPELVAAAVTVAREAGRPVCLTMPPNIADSLDPARPPMAIKLSALPRDGQLASWHARVAGVPMMPADAVDGRGAFAPRGAIPPYGVPAILVEAADAGPIPCSTGYMRGGEEAMCTFATESFVDELAMAMGLDPMGIRMAMLGGAPRLAKAVMTAAAIAKWDGGRRGSLMGMACASIQGSHIALVVEAAIGVGQTVAVKRMVAAVDCGIALNPGLVRQQIEGGLLAGLANAVLPAPEYVGGMIVATSPRDRSVERLAAVPKIEVELIDSKAPSGGVSGLGMAVIAPAVANALFAGSGRRLRKLPFDLMAG